MGTERATKAAPAEFRGRSGRPPGLHRIQGIGAGFIPEIVDRGLIDEIVSVGFDTALRVARSG
jgi:cysteine synthase A